MRPFRRRSGSPLEGGLRPVRGALPVAIAVRNAGLKGLILPRQNTAEAAVVEGVKVPAVGYRELSDAGSGEASAAIRERVIRARERQLERFAHLAGIHANAHMRAREIRDFCRLGEAGDALLRTAISRLGFSARAYHRVLKIALTPADPDGAAEIGTSHVAEAIQYRPLDRLLGG
jgi:predicted ATPase with chaperone activity